MQIAAIVSLTESLEAPFRLEVSKVCSRVARANEVFPDGSVPKPSEWIASPASVVWWSAEFLRDGSGGLRAYVVTFLSDLAEVINQGLEFGAFRGEEGFAMELGGQDLIFGAHASSLSVHGPRKSEPSARVLPPGQLRRQE